MREAVIVASCRTPLAKSHRGSFNITRPDDLAAHCIRHVLGKAPALDKAEIEEVVLGCGQPHGAAGHNIARVAALRAGLPVTTAGVTVNRFCNSGLQAIVQAAHMVLQEGVEAAIGGGVESITMMQRDSSPNPWVKEHIPASTWRWARRRKSSPSATASPARRRTSCRSSASSGSRTAQQDGFFDDELAPMRGARAPSSTRRPARRSAKRTVRVDARRVQSPRHDARRAGEAAAGVRHDERQRQRHRRQLVAALRRRVGDAGDVERRARRRWGSTPLLVFRGYAVAGCEPDEMGIGPVFAVPKLLKKHGLRVDDIDVWELNEAFASQVVYCRDRLGIPMDRLNVNGGSIAIGHPFGMTGSRLVGTIASEMARRQARYGVVTMCVGGGQGAAALFERA